MVEPRTLEETYPEAILKLQSWGTWSVDQHNIGWPRASDWNAANEGGGINTKGSGLKIIPDNPEAEEMEVKMIELKTRHPLQFHIMKWYFSTSLPIKIIAIKVKAETGRQISKEKARSILREGVAWIDGGLN